jgi:uncharacterized iron-regulated membrane protein
MPPRKRPLLDVLREKERRQTGRREGEDGGGANPPALSLPPWTLQAVGGVLLLVLAVWGLSQCGGAPGSPEEDPGSQEQAAPAEDDLVVLAVTYDAAREELARQVGLTLRDDLGYIVQLARNQTPDGRELRELYVVGATGRDLTPEDLLAEVQGLALPDRPDDRPFAGASLRRLPVE